MPTKKHIGFAVWKVTHPVVKSLGCIEELAHKNYTIVHFPLGLGSIVISTLFCLLKAGKLTTMQHLTLCGSTGTASVWHRQVTRLWPCGTWRTPLGSPPSGDTTVVCELWLLALAAQVNNRTSSFLCSTQLQHSEDFDAFSFSACWVILVFP